MNVATLKKVKLQVDALHSAKLKDEKANKSKKTAKGRSTVKMDLEKVCCGKIIWLDMRNLIKSFTFFIRTCTVEEWATMTTI